MTDSLNIPTAVLTHIEWASIEKAVLKLNEADTQLRAGSVLHAFLLEAIRRATDLSHPDQAAADFWVSHWSQWWSHPDLDEAICDGCGDSVVTSTTPDGSWSGCSLCVSQPNHP